MLEKIKEYFRRRRIEIPQYGLLLFDHALGEYPSMAKLLTNEEREKCEAIQARRESKTLTWKDIYTYKLMLLEHYNLETLKSKIIGLRVKYQSLVEIAEYNNYTTLRAVDLTKPVNEEDKERMQTDYTYLLDEFFLRYAYVSAHEEFRTRLLWRGAWFTFFFFLLSGVFIILSFIPGIENYDKIYSILKTFSTLIAVVFAGVMGAFVSMQERLQTFTHHGDPIYNLSLLTHGWLSIFLSPISGAIFAAILYLFFTAGLLKGAVFPEMTTSPSENNSSLIIELTNFILETGPKTGKDFALLIIWSFIAGFAERFVPDTLMRLVNQKKTGETTSS